MFLLKCRGTPLLVPTPDSLRSSGSSTLRRGKRGRLSTKDTLLVRRLFYYFPNIARRWWIPASAGMTNEKGSELILAQVFCARQQVLSKTSFGLRVNNVVQEWGVMGLRCWWAKLPDSFGHTVHTVQDNEPQARRPMAREGGLSFAWTTPRENHVLLDYLYQPVAFQRGKSRGLA
jgi:hypothetical protein